MPSITEVYAAEVEAIRVRQVEILRAVREHAARTLREAAALKLTRVLQQVALNRPMDNYGGW